MIIGLKMWPLERTQDFSKIWPSDLVFDQTWPIFNSSETSSRQTFWQSFKIIRQKMWPLECAQGFSKIWPSDLVFHLPWPIFELVQYFIKTNILINFHDYWTENVVSRAYTRQKVDDGHSTITIAHPEHFVLRWAKNAGNQHFLPFPKYFLPFHYFRLIYFVVCRWYELRKVQTIVIKWRVNERGLTTSVFSTEEILSPATSSLIATYI